MFRSCFRTLSVNFISYLLCFLLVFRFRLYEQLIKCNKTSIMTQFQTSSTKLAGLINIAFWHIAFAKWTAGRWHRSQTHLHPPFPVVFILPASILSQNSECQIDSRISLTEKFDSAYHITAMILQLELSMDRPAKIHELYIYTK